MWGLWLLHPFLGLRSLQCSVACLWGSARSIRCSVACLWESVPGLVLSSCGFPLCCASLRTLAAPVFMNLNFTSSTEGVICALCGSGSPALRPGRFRNSPRPYLGCFLLPGVRLSSVLPLLLNSGLLLCVLSLGFGCSCGGVNSFPVISF